MNPGFCAGGWANRVSSRFENFTGFFGWDRGTSLGGSHIQLELLLEAPAIWESCCLVFSKKERRNGWAAALWILVLFFLFVPFFPVCFVEKPRSFSLESATFYSFFLPFVFLGCKPLVLQVFWAIFMSSWNSLSICSINLSNS